ncbi:hypothetical protein H6P81_007158 [Aristolochia fimbriata]|uniref:Glabrous enhancer-binding protein-like DBD domain-containing protein n=1 Tax=Aristolochia fimbriata TaxID=158543 RepID=A0AAV7F0N9_ARIFI|nr:hypothetical protein H6P81_007158 [Aristolochia fimbriata]
MAPKRPAPPSPPASSSSGEEEDSGNSSPPAKQKPSAKKAKPQPPPPASPQPQPAIPTDQNSSSGESESEDDDEDAGTGKYTVQPTTQKPKSPEQTASDESSSGSGSESEPESPPSKPVTRSGDPKVKPINSKPMSVKDGGKAPLATPSKTAAEPSVSDEEPPKKQPFQRIWTEESEVEILKGVLDFKKEGRDPFAEMGAFHDRVRKLIDISCSKTQLADKLRRLKKKYENNAKRGKKGKDPEFSKAHEKTGFELSKQIWGPKKKPSNDDDKAPKANGPAREEVTDSKGEAPKASKASRNVKKDKSTDSLIETTRSQDAPLSEETRDLILQFCSKEVDMCESLVKQAVDLIEPSKVHELVEKVEQLALGKGTTSHFPG